MKQPIQNINPASFSKVSLTHTQTHTHTHTHTLIYICVCVCVCIYIYIYMCVCVYIQGVHKVFPQLQTFITRKLRGIQTIFFYHYLS